MRELSTADKIRRLMEELGRRAEGPGRIYLVGGSTAVLEGWRPATKDVDLKLDPEPPGVFPAIRALKDELAINVELASPDHFIPPVPGWEQRSRYIARYGEIDFYHYDPVGQALAKIERGHAQDLADVRAMLEAGLVDTAALEAGLTAILPALERYPAIDAATFAAKVRDAATSLRAAPDADDEADDEE